MERVILREFTDKSIGSGEPELRETLQKYSNMSEREKNRLVKAILKNLNIPKKEEEKVKKK